MDANPRLGRRGYIEDGKRKMDWHFADEDWEDYLNGLLRSIDAMIFDALLINCSRKYWPTAGDQHQLLGEADNS
jgi:hypothetical protein